MKQLEGAEWSKDRGRNGGRYKKKCTNGKVPMT